jgi:Ni,Fe-hydrogenase III small subunit/ferredoxin
VSIWALRGLRDGIVTTRWPRRPDEYADSWRGPVTVRPDSAVPGPAAPAALAHPGMSGGGGASTSLDISGNGAALVSGLADVEALCPTGAIEVSGWPEDARLSVDQGRCVLCGRCVAARPDLFAWSAGATGTAAAALARQALVVPHPPETDEEVAAARAGLAARTAALHRSVHVRHVDAGSDGSEEWEIQALLGPVYDIHRLGVFFTASPRHADVLMVTGAGTVGMTGPLRTTYEGMPDPKVVIAVGTDAISGGLLSDRLTGAASVIPVDVWVPGSPPSPFAILNALLIGTGRLVTGARR